MQIQNQDFRYDINALRAIAIIAVVAYHYNLGFSGGFVGVDIFFVISGFLISSHIINDLNHQRFTYAKFYEARIRRICPALAVLCLACVLWQWFFVLPKEYLSYTRHALQALLFFSNYAFNDERGYFAAASHTKPLLHTWSLSVEAQFYLFLPLVLTLIWRYIYQQRIALLTALCLLSFGFCLYYGQINASSTFYLLPTRAWEFLTGTLLALLPIQKPKPLLANVLSFCALMLLAISIFLFDAQLLWPSVYTVLPVFGTALLILTNETRLTRYIFNSWLCQRLGDISYSFYLWHWSVLVFARHYSTYYLNHELSNTELFALIVLVLLLSVLSWRFIEKPIRVKQGFWSKQKLYIANAMLITSFIALTISAAMTKGFPQRLPEYVQRGFAAVTLNTPRAECFRNETSTKSAPEAFCQFGNHTPPNLLLWGDSHANMYLTALTLAANQMTMSGYIATQTGCRPTLADETNDLTGQAGLFCTAFNNEVNHFILNTPSIKTVIIARMWTDKTSMQKTVALIHHLIKQGKQVILVGAVPYLPFSVPEHWMYQQIKQQQAIDYLNADGNQTALFNLQQSVLQDLQTDILNQNLLWFSPLNRLCSDSACQLVKLGVCYFKDVTHLSEAGALLFTDDFVLALRQIK